jgi:hypothetical protein
VAGEFRKVNGSTGHPLLGLPSIVLSDSVAAAQPSLPESIDQLDDEPTAVVTKGKRFADDVGDEYELAIGVREGVLRIRSAALHLELLRLQQAAKEAPTAMPAGRFTSALDVSTFVLDLIGRINASLLRERARRASTDERAWRAIYEITLANAEWAFEMIGKDRDLARFLVEGGRSGSRRFRESCQMLGLLLGASVAGLDRAARKHLSTSAVRVRSQENQ